MREGAGGGVQEGWFSFALGLAFLVALWAGGKPADGVFSLAVLTGFGLHILLGGRSETIRG